MTSKSKFYLGITCFVLYLCFHGYLVYHNWQNPNPRLIEWAKTPVNWIDVGLAFTAGAVTVIVAMLLAISWPYTKWSGSGPDNGGGQKRRITLPIIGKVISIEEFKKIPPKGPVQLAPTGS